MQDIVRDLTERIVKYLDKPKEERQKERGRTKVKETWPTLWFGMVPTAFRMYVDQRKKNKNGSP